MIEADKMANILSVVVARKGSKGLPSKCTLPLNKKPVIEHVISWASSLDTKSFDFSTVLTTDIVNLDELCNKYRVKYLPRDPSLAQDNIRIDDVIMDAIKKEADEIREEMWDGVHDELRRLDLIPQDYPGKKHSFGLSVENGVMYQEEEGDDDEMPGFIKKLLR